MSRRVALLLASVVVILALLYLAPAFYATSQVTGEHPEWRVVRARPADFGLQAERVAFTSSDGVQIVAWWLPASAARGAIVLAHGNSGNRSDMLARAAFLLRAGFSVLAIDLRAHGESSGAYMTPGYLEAEDILAGIAFLVEHDAPHPLAVLGYSYGAVAAIEAGSRSPEVAAVIADSGFPSVRAMLDRSVAALAGNAPWLAAALSVRDLPGLNKLNALAFRLRTGVTVDLIDLSVGPAIARLGDRPLLVLSGANDPLAVPEDARKIFAASRSKGSRFVILEGATHRTYELATDRYEAAVLDFLGVLAPATGEPLAH